VFDTPQQEKEILIRLIQGDELAFEKIYRLYSPGLYGKLLKLLKSVPQTEEILQDVFLKIWDYRASIDPEKSFRAFLFKIAENKAYDFFRKAARDKKFEVSELLGISLSTISDHIVKATKSVRDHLEGSTSVFLGFVFTVWLIS